MASTSVQGAIRALASTIILTSILTSACSILDNKVADDFQHGRSRLLQGNADEALIYFRRIAAADPHYVNDSNMLGESIWTYLGRAYYAKGNFAEAGEAFAQALKQNHNDTMARLYHGLILIRSSQLAVNDHAFSLENIIDALKEHVASEHLVTSVREKGVNFQLTLEAENNMRRAGADNELIETVRRISLVSANSPQQKAHEQGLQEVKRSLTTIDKWLQYLHESPRNKYWDPEKKISSRAKATLAMLASGNIKQQELIDNTEWVGKALEEEADLAKKRRTGAINSPHKLAFQIDQLSHN